MYLADFNCFFQTSMFMVIKAAKGALMENKSNPKFVAFYILVCGAVKREARFPHV